MTIVEPVAIETDSLVPAKVGTPYVQAISATGNQALTFAGIGLVQGLEFNTQTHETTGTPLLDGYYPFTVTVTDIYGISASKTYTLVIEPPAIEVDTVMTNALRDRPYAQVIIANGDYGPFTLSAGQQMPTGLNVSLDVIVFDTALFT